MVISMKDLIEVWKDVVGYEGLYQVSNLGNVKSCDKIRHGISYKTNYSITERFYKGRLLKKGICKGYQIVSLRKDGKSKTSLVHRLVAYAFLPCKMNDLVINHIDFNPLNNRVDNLQWCTHLENIRHTIKAGRKVTLYGENVGLSKLKNSDIPIIKDMNKKGISQRKIAEKYGVHQSCINKIVRGVTYKNI